MAVSEQHRHQPAPDFASDYDYWLQNAFTAKGASARPTRPSGILVRQALDYMAGLGASQSGAGSIPKFKELGDQIDLQF